MQPIITIFCAFTRKWAVDRWIENLRAVNHDPQRTNLCVIIDLDEPYILNKLRKFSDERKYRSFQFLMNEQHHPNEVRLTLRRQRVAEVKNMSKDLVAKTDGGYIISLEDDTVFDRLPDFNRLLQPLIEDSQVGFVEGVQMGRWGANVIGAWSCLFDQKGEITEASTLLPEQGYQPITGGGFYGYATRRELYLNHEYHSSTTQPWGPDVNFGLWLLSREYKCLIDWDTVFGHNDHNQIAWPEHFKLVRVVYNKDTNTGKWNRTDHEQSRY